MRIEALMVPVFISLTPAIGAAENGKYGQYFCFVEHAVGIISGENGPTYSGNITLREEQTKFFVSLSPAKYDRYNPDGPPDPSGAKMRREFCRKSVDYYMDLLEKGEPYARDKPGVDNRSHMVQYCFSVEELTVRFPGNNQIQRYMGYGSGFREPWNQETYNGLLGGEWFRFTGKTFTMSIGYVLYRWSGYRIWLL